MADDILRLEANASQYVDEIDKAVAALDRLQKAQGKTVQQAVSINNATGQVSASMSATAKGFGSAAASFEKINGQWVLTSNIVRMSTKNTGEMSKNFNAIAAAASKSAIKVGDFARATAAANMIPQEGLRKAAVARVETAKVQQPISTEQFTRNLRRGFEADIASMPLLARKNFKEIERQFAETGAQLGLTWDKFNKKFQAIQSGKLAIAPEGDVARFQNAALAYIKAVEQRQAAVQKLGQVQATASEMNQKRTENEAKATQRYGVMQATASEMNQKRAENEAKAIQRYGSLQAAAQAEDARRTQQQQARLQTLGKIESTAIAENQKRTASLVGVTKAQQDYAAFNARLFSGNLNLVKTTTDVNSATGKSVEVIRAATGAGEEYVATVRRQDGAIKNFNLRSNESVTAAANAAKQSENKAALAKQETLAVQGATGFYNQLGKSMVELTPRTISQNIATGESIERYRTLNRQGQEVITTITKQGTAIKGMTQQVQDQTLATKSLLLSWQSMVRIFTIQVLHQAVSALVSTLQQATEAAKNLQINIALIQTISEKSLNVEQWSKGILAVSDATGLLAEDVAKGTYDTLSNQIADGAEALTFMTKAGNFAVATNSTLQESVNAISSAINSYGLSAKDATHISDVFFRMIDLGRIQAKDFSNEIGRILPGAQQLGVRLEEVAAVLSTLTRSGVTPASAMTSLFNIFSRLIKPAGEMKEFLKQLGVASGQAAIQTYGFAQVLAKVAEFSQGKPEILGQLFPDIRGLRGILRLAGEGLKEFKADLKGMDDAAGSTDKALESFANNTGKRFQIEMNKVKNYFTGAFGTNILETVLKLSDAVGGLSNAMKVLGTEIIFIGKAIALTYMARFGASLIAAASSAQLLSLRLAGVTAFLKANPIGLIAVAFAVVFGYIEKKLNDQADQFDEMQDKLTEFLKNAQAVGAELTEKALKPLDEAISKQTTSLNLLLANINKAYAGMSVELIKTNEEIMDSFKEVHESFVNYLGDSLSKTRDSIKETKNTLKDIKDFELTGQIKVDERIRKIRLDDAETAIEKQKLLNEEIAITTQEMNKEQNRDKRVALAEKIMQMYEDLHKLDREQGKEAIKNEKERIKAIEEKRKLEQELVDIQKKQAIAELEKKKKINTESKKSGVTTVDGKIIAPAGVNQQLIESKDSLKDEQYARRIEEIKAKIREINATLKDSSAKYKAQNNLVSDLNKLKEEMLRLDREQAAAEKEKLKILEKQEDALKQAVKDANQAFKDIEDVKFDKLVDPDTTQEKFNKILEAGNKAVETLSGVSQKFAGKDYEKGVQYAKELAKVKGSLEETAVLAGKRRAAADLANQIDALNALQQDKRKKIQEEMNIRRNLAAGLQTNIKSDVDTVIEAQKLFETWWRPGMTKPGVQEGQRVGIDVMLQLVKKIQGGTATTEEVRRLENIKETFKTVAEREGIVDKVGLNLIKAVEAIIFAAGPIAKQNDAINAMTVDINKTVESIDALTKVMSEKFGIDLGKLFENSQNINKLVANTEDIVQKLQDGFAGVIGGLSPEARKQALSTEPPTAESKKNVPVAVPVEIKGTPSGPPEGWMPEGPITIKALKSAPLPVIMTDEKGNRVITNVDQRPEVVSTQLVQLPPKVQAKEAEKVSLSKSELAKIEEIAARPKGPGGPAVTRDEFLVVMKGAWIEEQKKKQAPTTYNGEAIVRPTIETMMNETAESFKKQQAENRTRAAEAEARNNAISQRIAESFDSSINRFNASINNEIRSVNRLADIITNIPQPEPVAVVNLPPKPQAFGGLMHGSDNIPALLSKGEFVVNANATRRFYSQLVSMNQVRGYANGGLVTNVGDINVSMSSSGNAQADIVAIGKGLRREIRRGRVRLS